MSLHHHLASTLLAGAVFATALPAAAEAQAVRYVASYGDNANACTRTAPCRTLQKGINKTPPGGELQILDSGSYGNQVAIAKAVTVSATGVAATVGNIAIEAPGAAVVLRGLTVTAIGAANPATGILVSAAAAVHIAGCQVERFSGQLSSAIKIDAGGAEIYVTDTAVRGPSSYGMHLSNISNNVRLTIVRSRFENHPEVGVRIVGANGRTTIEDSVAAGNGTGLYVAGSTIVSVSGSVFTNNGTGLWNAGGGATLRSRRNNTVIGNEPDTFGSITTFPAL
jgi:hypothetical protein